MSCCAALRDNLPSIQIARQIQVPFQIIPRRSFWRDKYLLALFRQHMRINGMMPLRSINIYPSSLAFDYAALPNRSTQNSRLPFTRKPFPGFEDLSKVANNIREFERGMRP